MLSTVHDSYALQPYFCSESEVNAYLTANSYTVITTTVDNCWIYVTAFTQKLKDVDVYYPNIAATQDCYDTWKKEGCCIPESEGEIPGDSKDNDCDGLVDEVEYLEVGLHFLMGLLGLLTSLILGFGLVWSLVGGSDN